MNRRVTFGVYTFSNFPTVGRTAVPHSPCESLQVPHRPQKGRFLLRFGAWRERDWKEAVSQTCGQLRGNKFHRSRFFMFGPDWETDFVSTCEVVADYPVHINPNLLYGFLDRYRDELRERIVLEDLDAGTYIHCATPAEIRARYAEASPLPLVPGPKVRQRHEHCAPYGSSRRHARMEQERRVL